MATITKSTEIGPGQMKTVDVYGVPVLIANVDGAYFAVTGVCPHDGASLSQGRLDGKVVTCGSDGSQFDLASGNVLTGPAKVRVRTYRVQVKAGELSI